MFSIYRKFVFFGATDEVVKSARHIAEEDRKDVDVVQVSTEDCVEAAKNAVSGGAEIIIARGTQAADIKRNTAIPVVDVVLTAQEMGLVIKQIKQELGKPVPLIGVVGYRNMFCDMRHFDELFDIRLREYYVKGTAELEDMVVRALRDHVDLIIGGEIVCLCAKQMGIPCKMQPAGEDSIRQAFRVAQSVAYAAEQEKKTVSELNTLLDFSFNGLLKINNDGVIQALNHQIEDLFGISGAELTGTHIDRLIPSLYGDSIRQEVVVGGQDVFTIIRIREMVLAVSAAPVKVEGRVNGVIVSIHESNRLTEIKTETRRELNQGDTSAQLFERYFAENAAFMRMAHHYAMFEACVLITADPGIPREIPARIVHRESLRDAAPFICFSCGACPPERQMSRLFRDSPQTAEKSPAMLANNGTLFIDDVELLEPQAQYRLYKLITEKVSCCGDEPPVPLDLRIIAGTEANLWTLVQEGRFRKDLYFALSTLPLSLPSLDAEHWAPVFIQHYCSRHSRYLNLTKGARAALAEYRWEGGLVELNSFCERLVITAPQKTVDEMLIDRLLRQNRQARECPERAYRDPEASRIADLLDQYGGNRTQIAEALGISKTTLWRRMKKLGLYDADPVS